MNKSSQKPGTLTLEQVKELQAKAEKQQQEEIKKWVEVIKVLSPKVGDVLVLPAEANIDWPALSIALLGTLVKYALIVPQANAKLMPLEEVEKFIKAYIDSLSPENKERVLKSVGA